MVCNPLPKSFNHKISDEQKNICGEGFLPESAKEFCSLEDGPVLVVNGVTTPINGLILG